MIAAAALTRDPRRLAALCDLWQRAECEIWITLQGVSMTPTILPGSRLRLRCRRRDILVGEVIAYRQGGMLIIHRLVQIEEDPQSGRRWYICFGDGNREPDPPAPEEVVVGVIVEVREPPLWKRMMSALCHPRRHSRRAVRALRKAVRRRSPETSRP